MLNSAAVRAQLCWFAIAIALVGCQKKTPDEKLAKDIDPATSWIATLDFAAADWLGNRVPSRFMVESIKNAQKTLDKTRQSAEESKASEQMRKTVQQQLRIAADAAAELNGAIQQNDRIAVQRVRTRLSSAYRTLHEIEEQQQ